MNTYRSLIAGLFLPLFACGEGGGFGLASKKETTVVQQTRVYAATVETDAELPKCDVSTVNQMVYSFESESFFVCSETGEWTVVDAVGDDGSNGKDAMVQVVDIGGGCKEVLSGSDTDGDGKLTDKDTGYHKELLCNVKDETIADNATSLYKTFRSSVYRIRVTCGSLGSSGTGFRCGDGMICTAGHVLAGCMDNSNTVQPISKVDVFYLDGSLDSGTQSGSQNNVLYTTNTPEIDKQLSCPDLASIYTSTECIDLARLIVPEEVFTPFTMPVMQLTDQKPSDECDLTLEDPEFSNCVPFPPILMQTLSLSFPLGLEELYTDLGHVNTNHIDDCGNRYAGTCGWYDFATTNDTDHGSSGSPILSIATGKVIGVVVSGTEGENANYTWNIGAWMFNSPEYTTNP